LKASELRKVFALLQAGQPVELPEDIAERLKLNLIDKVKIRLGFRKFVGCFTDEHWKGKLPYYISWCPMHKQYFVDYPHGYYGRLDCPLCSAEACGVDW
jgi:hypothetical protein